MRTNGIQTYKQQSFRGVVNNTSGINLKRWTRALRGLSEDIFGVIPKESPAYSSVNLKTNVIQSVSSPEYLPGAFRVLKMNIDELIKPDAIKKLIKTQDELIKAGELDNIDIVAHSGHGGRVLNVENQYFKIFDIYNDSQQTSICIRQIEDKINKQFREIRYSDDGSMIVADKIGQCRDVKHYYSNGNLKCLSKGNKNGKTLYLNEYDINGKLTQRTLFYTNKRPGDLSMYTRRVEYFDAGDFIKAENVNKKGEVISVSTSKPSNIFDLLKLDKLSN